MNNIQETCQKNAASALAVGRRDLVQVWRWLGPLPQHCPHTAPAVPLTPRQPPDFSSSARESLVGGSAPEVVSTSLTLGAKRCLPRPAKRLCSALCQMERSTFSREFLLAKRGTQPTFKPADRVTVAQSSLDAVIFLTLRPDKKKSVIFSFLM